MHNKCFEEEEFLGCNSACFGEVHRRLGGPHRIHLQCGSVSQAGDQQEVDDKHVCIVVTTLHQAAYPCVCYCEYYVLCFFKEFILHRLCLE
jgi:hypothetical protein